MNNYIDLVGKVVVILMLIAVTIACAVMVWVVLTGVQVRSDCIKSLEVRFNYLERKLCDPMSPEPCYIDPTLQTELGDWYERELIKCDY